MTHSLPFLVRKRRKFTAIGTALTHCITRKKAISWKPASSKVLSNGIRPAMARGAVTSRFFGGVVVRGLHLRSAQIQIPNLNVVVALLTGPSTFKNRRLCSRRNLIAVSAKEHTNGSRAWEI